MGRHIKHVLTGDGMDRRVSGYYSTPKFIAQFLFEELFAINPAGASVFDPCVGREELLEPFIEAGVSAQGFDNRRYLQQYGCAFSELDFLDFYRQQLARNIKALPFDFFVANPPYNCHETDYVRENKIWLRKTFADVGVANMYSMFIAAMIDLAKDGALIGLLSFDSFLTAGLHCELRKKILATCQIHTLILCPTDLFLDQGG